MEQKYLYYIPKLNHKLNHLKYLMNLKIRLYLMSQMNLMYLNFLNYRLYLMNLKIRLYQMSLKILKYLKNH